MLDKSIRELDRERNNLQSQEKKLIADIKKMAKQNQMGAVKVRSLQSDPQGVAHLPDPPPPLQKNKRKATPFAPAPSRPTQRSTRSHAMNPSWRPTPWRR